MLYGQLFPLEAAGLGLAEVWGRVSNVTGWLRSPVNFDDNAVKPKEQAGCGREGGDGPQWVPRGGPWGQDLGRGQHVQTQVGLGSVAEGLSRLPVCSKMGLDSSRGHRVGPGWLLHPAGRAAWSPSRHPASPRG